jgi:hypothetical protein
VVGKFGRAVNADASCRLDPGITGYVAVVVEMHEFPHFVVWLMPQVVFDNRILGSIIENMVCDQKLYARSDAADKYPIFRGFRC